MKILITGGGTGGHLFPALAVAEGLKSKFPQIEILFVGANRGLESKEVPQEGYAFRGLDTVGFPRRPGPKAFVAGFSFLRSILAARNLVREFEPDVVFSTGGYASAPLVVGAWIRGVPILLHEQNSVPGLTNRVASRMAAEVHLAFASARRFFPRRRHLRLSGNPLRSLVTAGSRSRALRLFRLDDDRLTVLVLGGSQGAHSINQALLEALPSFKGRSDLQFLIQTGPNDHDAILERCRILGVKSWVRRFITNIGDAYSLADLVVCRAGAMTLSELAACGLPSVLVPYPHATANHQWLNAEQMSEAGAAIILPDHEISGPKLAATIEDLFRNSVRLREMSINALRMARPAATERITLALAKYLPGAEPPPEPPLQRGRPYDARRQSGRVAPRGPENRSGGLREPEARGPENRSRGLREPEARGPENRSRGPREPEARSAASNPADRRRGSGNPAVATERSSRPQTSNGPKPADSRRRELAATLRREPPPAAELGGLP